MIIMYTECSLYAKTDLLFDSKDEFAPTLPLGRICSNYDDSAQLTLILPVADAHHKIHKFTLVISHATISYYHQRS